MKLLTIHDTAKQLALAPKTVRRWVKEGKLRGVWLGREWRVDEDDLAVFVARRRT